MSEGDLVEVKFHLFDGLDVGPFRFSPAFVVAILKDRIVATSLIMETFFFS